MGMFGDEKPKKVKILDDLYLTCTVCKHDHFWRGEGRLQTTGVIAPGWSQPAASFFVCAHCGYMHWFLPKDAW
ncbi:MAG: hypothetical protein KIS92_11775 [Planctomycetota bacterium]|nr:hypothetical protein [Planctomycetota bacterium]